MVFQMCSKSLMNFTKSLVLTTCLGSVSLNPVIAVYSDDDNSASSHNNAPSSPNKSLASGKDVGHITDQFVFQTFSRSNLSDKNGVGVVWRKYWEWRDELCEITRVERDGSFENNGKGIAGILFRNKGNKNAPLMVHFRGAGVDRIGEYSWNTMFAELVESGFSVFCPNYENGDDRSKRSADARLGIERALAHLQKKDFAIDAFSYGVEVALDVLKDIKKINGNNNECKLTSEQLTGVHFRVGCYKPNFYKGLEEAVPCPMLISLAGKDDAVGNPHIGFKLIKHMLKLGQGQTFFHFMRTGNHHLIPPDLVQELDAIPTDGEDDVRMQNYLDDVKTRPAYRILDAYVQYKQKYFDHLKTPQDKRAPFNKDEELRRLHDEMYSYYGYDMYSYYGYDRDKLKSVFGASPQPCELEGDSGAGCPSATYKQYYEKCENGPIICSEKYASGSSSLPKHRKVSEKTAELAKRALNSEAYHLKRFNTPDQPNLFTTAYHGVHPNALILYLVYSLFDLLWTSEFGEGEIRYLRDPRNIVDSRPITEDLAQAVARGDAKEQQAYKYPLNYQADYADKIIAASPWVHGGHAREAGFALEFVNKPKHGADLRKHLYVFFANRGIVPNRYMIDRYVKLAEECPPALLQLFIKEDFFNQNGYWCEVYGEPIASLKEKPSAFYERFSQDPEAAEAELAEHKDDFKNPRGEEGMGDKGWIPELQMRLKVTNPDFPNNVFIKVHPQDKQAYGSVVEQILNLMREDRLRTGDRNYQMERNNFKKLVADVLANRSDLLEEQKLFENHFTFTFDDPMAESAHQKTNLFTLALEKCCSRTVLKLWDQHPKPVELAKSHNEKILNRIYRDDDALILEHLYKLNPEEITSERFAIWVVLSEWDRRQMSEMPKVNCVQFCLNQANRNWLKVQIWGIDAQTDVVCDDPIKMRIKKKDNDNRSLNWPPQLSNTRFYIIWRLEDVMRMYKKPYFDKPGENKDRLNSHRAQLITYIVENARVAIDKIPFEGTKRWVAAYFYQTLKNRWTAYKENKNLKVLFKEFKERYNLKFDYSLKNRLF